MSVETKQVGDREEVATRDHDIFLSSFLLLSQYLSSVVFLYFGRLPLEKRSLFFILFYNIIQIDYSLLTLALALPFDLSDNFQKTSVI